MHCVYAALFFFVFRVRIGGSSVISAQDKLIQKRKSLFFSSCLFFLLLIKPKNRYLSEMVYLTLIYRTINDGKGAEIGGQVG